MKTFAHEMLHDCGVDASSIAADGNCVAVLSASDQKILVFQLNFKGSQIKNYKYSTSAEVVHKETGVSVTV